MWFIEGLGRLSECMMKPVVLVVSFILTVIILAGTHFWCKADAKRWKGNHDIGQK